ncbi:hypothetical protein EDB83DRAFT_2435048 [Lactarius deliciosus]|nr:hypothetical protein EDB83DRAFT_2435048 [Lactarius deliciosus]
MVNLGASASDLMVRDVTEGSVSRQTLVVREEGRHQRTFNLAIVSDADSLALYRALTGQMGWTTCIAVTSVHCGLKAANILTTKTGNLKLSDFGVSLNLRAMEREIMDVTGTPNWMVP